VLQAIAMRDDKVRFRHLMLYKFKKRNNATTASKNICDVYGEGAVLDRTCHKWFSRFCEGDAKLNDKLRTGHPLKIDDNKIHVLTEND
jgi:hypothetical protein